MKEDIRVIIPTILGAISVLGIVVLILAIGTICVCLCSCGAGPTYFVTSQGVRVDTSDIEDITLEETQEALEYFAENFPKLIKEVSEEEIRKILAQTILIWEPEPFDCQYLKKKEGTDEWYWALGKCMGTQLGYYLRIHWTGDIPSCALFHELIHEVMQFAIEFIDYKHEEKEWWDAEGILNSHYPEPVAK